MAAASSTAWSPRLEMLPYVVDRVGHRTAVMMDGGIRRSGDVLKAMALGARMVF